MAGFNSIHWNNRLALCDVHLDHVLTKSDVADGMSWAVAEKKIMTEAMSMVKFSSEVLSSVFPSKK